MDKHKKLITPRRITDLTHAKRAGAEVEIRMVFEILPVDFQHQTNPFQAFIFLARYTGKIDNTSFAFRKCYARGCPNNLCTHVSQAVRIANRYLQRDYHELKKAGIKLDEQLFTLEDMVVKFETLKAQESKALTIPDLIGVAASGKKAVVEIALEFVPAVEHFANKKNAQTFLSGEFKAVIDDETYRCHRCFSCYTTGRETDERQLAIDVANNRLELIYQAFDQAFITYNRAVFT